MNEDTPSPNPATDGNAPGVDTVKVPVAADGVAAPATLPVTDSVPPAAPAAGPGPTGASGEGQPPADGAAAADTPEGDAGPEPGVEDATAGPDSAPAATDLAAAPSETASASSKTSASTEVAETQAAIDPLHVLTEASPEVLTIIIVMVLMGLGCVYVAIERTWALGNARRQSRALAEAAALAMADGGAEAALELARQPEFKDAYLGRLLVSALGEFTARRDRHGIEAAERALTRAALDEDPVLKKGFGILATTGATCPFVGLVGTIFGIIAAFGAMQGEGGANVMALVGPIAEALYATAIGIGVAILGVWLFNYFNHRVEQIKKDMNTSTLELLDWCEKQILPPVDNAAD